MFKNITSRTLLFLLLLNLTAQCQQNVELVPFATGFINPVEISHAGDDRLFVIEQAGLIRIVNPDGSINSEPFLNITDRVKSGGEQGLLGLAFHPNYTSNGYFYVNYTDDNNDTHIARFNVTAANPQLADASSEKTLLVVEQPYQNHNGGEVAFGPDGFLYIGLGDGGSGGDPGNRAQNLMSYLGKMLRIDVNNGDPYEIPEDNPFVNNPDALGEIWAYGLRNPWRFSFDRETGNLWIGDVGQNQIEEIDMQPVSSSGGENYGWRCYEGSNAYNTDGCDAIENYVFPVFEYSHGDGCSVTGGFVYRGQISEIQGHYFLADYCTDYIWTLHLDGNSWNSNLFGQFSGNNFSTFGEDVNGELYIAGYSSGTIYKFKDTTSGLIEPADSKKVRVSPNPFHDQVEIGLKEGTKSSEYIRIINLQGMEVFKSPYVSDSQMINLGFLPGGVYVLWLDGKNDKIYSKITKL